MNVMLVRDRMPAVVRRSDFALVAVLVALCTAVYLPTLGAIVLVGHDDVISVIASTCNQSLYERFIPRGQWVDASMWQDYWQMHAHGCFAEIQDGLTNYDIHPPLYFWLLHVWFMMFGVSITSGLILNVAILLITVVIVFRTCRLLSVSNFISFLAAFAWMFSLPSRTTVGVSRQYMLFSMLTALLLFLAILWLQRRQDRYLVALTVVLVLGLLTHYQFPIPAASVLLIAAAILSRQHDRRGVLELAGAGLTAGIVFLLIHPNFAKSVGQANAQAQTFSPVGFGQRIGAVTSTIFQVFNPLDWSHPLPYGLLDWNQPVDVVVNVSNMVIGAAGAYVAFRIVAKSFRAFRAQDGKMAALLTVGHLPILAAISSWLAVVSMYVFFVSPVHAIGFQYLHFTTSLLFIGLAKAAQENEPVLPRRVALALPAVIAVCAVVATTLLVAHRPEQERIYAVHDADALIVDSVEIGVLPTILWYAEPRTKVFAASQPELLAGLTTLPMDTAQKLVFVTSNAYGNSTVQRDQILQRLAGLGWGAGVRQPVEGVPLIPLGGDIYVFQRGSSPTGSTNAG